MRGYWHLEQNMSLVDANVILRYLLDDHETLSAKAADILERQSVTLPVEVACEVVYVLQKVYAVARRDIRQQLTDLLQEGLVSMDKPDIFVKALGCYADSTLDFVDCLLWAYHKIERRDVFSFDAKLQKHMQQVE